MEGDETLAPGLCMLGGGRCRGCGEAEDGCASDTPDAATGRCFRWSDIVLWSANQLVVPQLCNKSSEGEAASCEVSRMCCVPIVVRKRWVEWGVLMVTVHGGCIGTDDDE